MKIVILISIFLFIHESTVNCRITENTVYLKNGVAFLQKFAFFAYNGQYFLNITVDNLYESNFIVVIYIDNENEWNKFYDKNPTCQEYFSNTQLFHQFVYIKNFSIVLKKNKFTSYIHNNVLSSNGQSVYTFSLILACDRLHQEFPVLVSCILTNGNKQEFFRYQFSADEFYILESSITFLICYVFMIALFAYYRVVLIREKRESVLTILIGVVISIKLIVFFSQFFIYLYYGLNGKYSYIAFIIFELFNQYAVLIFMELVILLGFGLTIIFGKLTYKISLIIFVTGLIYFALITVVFISYLSTFNPAYAKDIYDQFCGHFLVAVQFLMAIIFIIGCSIMIAKQKDRRKFYCFFLVVIFLWFISVPVLILVSLNYISAYIRFATVIIARNSLDFLVHLAYILMTFPKLFPNLVMYTMPASKIFDISYDEAIENADKNTSDIQANNQQFFDISEFQVSEN